MTNKKINTLMEEYTLNYNQFKNLTVKDVAKELRKGNKLAYYLNGNNLLVKLNVPNEKIGGIKFIQGGQNIIENNLEMVNICAEDDNKGNTYYRPKEWWHKITYNKIMENKAFSNFINNLEKEFPQLTEPGILIDTGESEEDPLVTLNRINKITEILNK